MVLCQITVDCSLRIRKKVMPQVKQFKYLRVLFTSEGKMEHEIARLISAAFAVMQITALVPDHHGEE